MSPIFAVFKFTVSRKRAHPEVVLGARPKIPTTHGRRPPLVFGFGNFGARPIYYSQRRPPAGCTGNYTSGILLSGRF